MSAIILISGIPASGKTTICNGLERLIKEKVILFSFDDYIGEEVSKDTEISSYEDIPRAKVLRQSWEKFIFEKLKEEKFDFIFVDDIFYLQSQRRTFMKFASRNGFKFVVLKVQCDVEMAKERNRSRVQFPGLEITDDVIQNIFEKFEDEEDFICIDSTLKVEDIWGKVTVRLAELPTPEIKKSDGNDEIHINSTTEKDSVEVLSRKITGKIINSGFRSRGKEINDLRRTYLKNLTDDFDEKLFESFIIENLKKLNG